MIEAPTMPKPHPRSWLDSLGIACSLICLIHCLALPLAIALTPALSVFGHSHLQVHLLLLMVVLPTAVLGLHAGHRRHGRHLPWLPGGLGLALLLVGHLPGPLVALETPMTVVGGMLLAAAHWINLRLPARACVDPGCSPTA